MCGIVGIAAADPARMPPVELVDWMRDAVTPRGPDDAGSWTGPGVALGSRRLSILDLSPLGRMPMATADGRYRIVHNGEIYNFRELKASLEGRGRRFRTHTDTEVLLEMFAEFGPAMLPRLNGMFAFAIWDAVERRLFLARDRLGVKPLHYAVREGALYFSSEPKALFAGGVPREFDEATLPELLLFRFVAGEATLWRGVRRLLPGHQMTWQSGRIEIRPWWDLGDAVAARREAGRVTAEEYCATLADSVRFRLIADVPVGVLLSGGLDSTVVAGLAAQAGEAASLGAFTCRFREPEFDEGPAARATADRYGFSFHERFVEREDLDEGLRRATAFQEEPLAHSSHLHMLAVSELAKRHVKVLLSGEGADETLGGYVRYAPLRWPRVTGAAASLLGLLPRGLTRSSRLDKLIRLWSAGGVESYLLLNSCEVFPDALKEMGWGPGEAFGWRRDVLAEARRTHREPFRQAMFLDQKTFLVSLLDRNDRMTMAASIECRVPFLDYRLVEMAGALPTRALFSRGRGKALVRRRLAALIPEEVRRGRKWGFGVPWKVYLREVPALAARVQALPEHPLWSATPLHRGRLRQAVQQYLAGDDAPSLLVQTLLMTVIWHDACVTGAPRPALAAV